MQTKGWIIKKLNCVNFQEIVDILYQIQTHQKLKKKLKNICDKVMPQKRKSHHPSIGGTRKLYSLDTSVLKSKETSQKMGEEWLWEKPRSYGNPTRNQKEYKKQYKKQKKYWANLLITYTNKFGETDIKSLYRTYLVFHQHWL